MHAAFIASCCGLLTACAELPLLPEHAPLPRVRVVQLISDEELAAQNAVWRRCTDCPAVTLKTRIEPEARPTPAAVFIAPRPVVVQAQQPLPRTELRFAFKSVNLSEAEAAALRTWASSWGPNAGAQLRITAFAEQTNASRRLCEDRTQAVQLVLQRLGIPFSQFERRVEVVSDPARRVAIEVTRLADSAAATESAAPFSPPEEAVTRPASDAPDPARTSLEPGALP